MLRGRRCCHHHCRRRPARGGVASAPGAGDVCDSFGPGSGFCLVQSVSRTAAAGGQVLYGASGEGLSPEDVARRSSGPSVVLLSSNCRVLRSGLESAGGGGNSSEDGESPKAQLLHCPRDVPVSVLTISGAAGADRRRWPEGPPSSKKFPIPSAASKELLLLLLLLLLLPPSLPPSHPPSLPPSLL
ncbi:unnamed protein product, partial [Prorocentrum cordatum]